MHLKTSASHSVLPLSSQATHQSSLFPLLFTLEAAFSLRSQYVVNPNPLFQDSPRIHRFPCWHLRMVFTTMCFLNSSKHKVLTLCSYDQHRNKPFLGSWQQENMLCFCSIGQSPEISCLIFQRPLESCWLRSQMKNSDVDRCKSQGISLGDSGCLQFSRTNGKTTGVHRCTDPWGTHTQSSLWH